MRALRSLLLFFAVPIQAQWQLQESHSAADFRGIDFVGNGVAWASGNHGTVLRTVDMGKTWQPCATPTHAENLDFRGVQAFDSQTAIVMSSGKGDLSRLYKTTDGCKTWKLVFTNPDKEGFWDATQFADITTGWLLGDPTSDHHILLQLQLDPGKQAYVQTDQSGSSTRAEAALQGSFAASNSALSVDTSFRCSHGSSGAPGFHSDPLIEIWFATGGKGGAFIYKRNLNCGTRQYGSPPSWEKAAAPLGSTSESSGVFAIAFAHGLFAKHWSLWGVAVGGDYLKPNDGLRSAAFSSNQGDQWTAATTLPHGYRSAVAYDKASTTWITVGPNGTDTSTDDGKNWRPLKPGPGDEPEADQHWNALSLPFVVGPKGRIGTLRDGVLSPAKH